MDGFFAQFGYTGRAGCGLSGTGGSGGTFAAASAHQTTHLFIPGVVTLYNAHDVRGNMTTNGDVRHYAYNVLNQATAVWRNDWTNPTLRTQYVYGPQGNRYRRTDDGSTLPGSTITYMVGNVERRYLPSGAIQWRRTIGDTAIVEYTSETFSSGIVRASGSGTTRHQFSDHQGSPQVIGLIDGGSVTVLERLDTSANGAWRTPSPPFGQNGSAHTTAGFTGHETMAGLDTLHMNGRLYWIGGMRMFQPDPIVTQPLNPQNWNPYSYVINNPLNLTDPSGYSFLGNMFGTMRGFIRSVMQKLGPEVTGIAIGVGCSFAGPWAALCAGGASYDAARAFGATSSDARRSGVAARSQQRFHGVWANMAVA